MENYVFAIPFRFNNLGQVSRAADTKEIWKTRVHMTLVTRLGERLMRPDFGTHLDTALFEDSATAVEIANRTITIAFNTWLSALKLIDITPKYDNYTGYIELTVSYTLPSGERDALAISTAIFDRTGALVQEISRG